MQIIRTLVYGNWFTVKTEIKLKLAQTKIKIEYVHIYNNLKLEIKTRENTHFYESDKRYLGLNVD